MLLFGADKAYAQRDLPGQTGIQFTTGGVNHFLSWKSGGERHYFTSLALTRTNRNRTHWLYGLDYQIKEYTYEGKAIPKAQFTGELGYFIPVLADKGRNVCLRVGLSALGGFETVNWGTSLLHDGATATHGGFRCLADRPDRLPAASKGKGTVRNGCGEFPYTDRIGASCHYQLTKKERRLKNEKRIIYMYRYAGIGAGIQFMRR